MQKILIVEDEEIMRISLEDSLKADGYEVESYERGADGIDAFNNKKFSLVISDVRLPDITGLDILETIKRVDKTVPVIIMTAFGTIEDAVGAMKLGAFDYITKPFSLEEFMLFVRKALEVKEHRDVSIKLKKELPECQGYSSIIGESDEMKRVFDLIGRVSQTDSTILILGENGTGKELVASAIHCQSKRKNKPLIKINCAAIPENLIESELFGYEKGAFTGAAQRKPGRFDLADKGSIFLDEIGDLPASIQIKLLRVLQDGSFERLGGTETINVDVKVIVATNRNLEEDVKRGRFREDLFYRLNVIPVQIPPLRERKFDIPLLIDHFTEYYNDSFEKKVTLTPDVVNILMDYSFPGNVRELENIIERCVALSINDEISVHELPPHLIKIQENRSDAITLSEVAAGAEREHIRKILKTTKGNKTKAADILGISRKTLWEKVKAYKIEQK
jgi:two-component system response regulator AtoC